MKIKSRPIKIFEIMIATIIFLIVIFSAVTGLISMNNNNKNLNFLSESNSCTDKIKNAINTSFDIYGSGENNFFALEENNGDYKLIDVSTLPGKRGDFPGFIIINRQSDQLWLADVVIKKQNQNNSSYVSESFNFDNNIELKNETLLSRINKTVNFKPISDCQAFADKSSVKIENPFRFAYINSFDSKHQSLLWMEASDFIYPAKSKTVFSRLFDSESRPI